jgi:hypothetical protein
VLTVEPERRLRIGGAPFEQRMVHRGCG